MVKKAIAAVFTVLVLSSALTGCNTTRGVGQDISDGGAQVQIENQICPPVGTEVMVKFKKAVGAINAEPVRMRVVHQLRNSIGLMFVRGAS